MTPSQQTTRFETHNRYRGCLEGDTGLMLYFARRIESFKKDQLEPPGHLRTTIRCEICREQCWANRDNYREAKRHPLTVVCDICMRDGRTRTG